MSPRIDRRVLLTGALAGLAWCAPAHAKEAGIVGLWRTIDDRDHRPRALVRIRERGGAFFGAIEGSLRGEPDESRCERCRGPLRGVRLLGLEILSDLRRGGERTFVGGRILDPDNGASYECRAALSEDGRVLTVRGFLGVSLLGRSQRWERVQEG